MFGNDVPQEMQQYLMDAYAKAQEWELPSGENYKNRKSVLIKKAGVIGGGTMGRGIAIALNRAGYDVTLIENDQKSMDWCKKELEITYKREMELKRFKQKDVDRLRGTTFRVSTNLKDLSTSDLVIEAVFENMQLKKDLLKKLDVICKKECIIGSNTSSLNIDEMASSLSSPSRLVGIHFFNPAHVIRVVEIVHGKSTSGIAVATAFEACRAMQKIAVLVGNCPGFVFNRMLFCYMQQAHRLLHEHGWMPKEVDEVVTCAGFIMGPITVHDMNGVDVGAKVKGENGWPLNPIEEELLKRGRLGRKTKKGFYLYDEAGLKYNDSEVEWLIRELSGKTDKKHAIVRSEEEALVYMLYPLVNEAYHLVENGLIAHPALIDIMFIFGFGWPPKTGGPLKWSENRMDDVHAKMTTWALADPTERTFLPSKKLQAMSRAKL